MAKRTINQRYIGCIKQAAGRDEFQGVYASTNRIFPAAALGQAVPPPFVTAVAKVLHQNGGVQIAEARKRIFIPQVVRFEHEPAAIEFLKNGLATTNNGFVTTIIEPMTNAEWAIQKARICTIAQAFYDATESNVRFVSDDVYVAKPYSTMKAVTTISSAFGAAPLNELNTYPNDSGALYITAFESSIAIRVLDKNKPYFPLPVHRNEIGFFWGRIACHETAHMLGLVATGNLLDGSAPVYGDSSGYHNKNPVGLRIMNPGKSTTLEEKLGRNGSWSWRLKNTEYLKFVLPKKEHNNEN